MSWDKKSSLIQKDRVTCARYFDHLVQLFIYEVLKSAAYPIGEAKDYFLRVEFQQRGSPHIHILFWIKNAPRHKYDLTENIEAFLNKYVTCNNSNDADLAPYVNYQIHKHSKTCKKRKNLSI